MSDTADTDATTDKPPCKRGRAKGHPKTGGRKKGTPNKNRWSTVERINRLADPIGMLCKLANGERMPAASKPGERKKQWWFPTPEQQINAWNTLARKTVPDQKAIEYTGDTSVQITGIERIIVRPGSEAAGNLISGLDPERPAEAPADPPVVSEPAPLAAAPEISRPDPEPRTASDKLADKLDASDCQTPAAPTQMEQVVRRARRR